MMMYLSASVSRSHLSNFRSGVLSRVVDDLIASLLPRMSTEFLICLFKHSAWMAIAFAYFNQPAYAVRDEWHGRCYEAISLDSPETKDLGPCQAYVVSSGYSRVI